VAQRVDVFARHRTLEWPTRAAILTSVKPSRSRMLAKLWPQTVRRHTSEGRVVESDSQWFGKMPKRVIVALTRERRCSSGPLRRASDTRTTEANGSDQTRILAIKPAAGKWPSVSASVHIN